MIQHLEPFHLNDLSDMGFKNFCQYCIKKGFIAEQLFPSFEDKSFRLKALQVGQGKFLLNIGQLLEFLDERVPKGAYDIKRSAQRNAWRFDHKEIALNTSEPAELISVLWNIAKIYFEKGTEITPA